MNGILYHASLWLFLALPVALLGTRFFRPRLMPWWVIPLILSIFGWCLVNATVHFYYEHLGDLISGYGDNPPQQLRDSWTADGAKRVFALFFGWLYGLIYSIPFLAIYTVAFYTRKLFLIPPNTVPITESKQNNDGAGQSATRPESESEGSEKPQPKAEGHSR